MNPYHELGLPPDATEEEIRRAYRKRAAETHPDHHPERTAEFKLVKLCYDVLSDPQRRQQYDETGSTEEAAPENAALSELANVWELVVQQSLQQGHDVERVDLMDRVRKALKNNIAGMTKDLADMDASAKSLEQVRKRIKRPRRRNQGNMLVKFVEQNLAKIAMNQAKCRQCIEVAEAALEMAEDYDYRCEEERVIRPSMATFTYGSTTT